MESNTAGFHPCAPDAECPYCNGSIKDGSDVDFDWSFIDAAYCISLKTREDRTASATAQFHQVGLCRHVLFYRPQKHPSSPITGIWDSHRAVGVHSLQRGCKRVLIMEDDILFKPRLRPPKVLKIAQALDKLPPEWLIFFLGHWPLWAYPVRYNILRCQSACAHAYIASRRLLRWLNEHPYDSSHKNIFKVVGHGIDAAYAKFPATYALFPMIAIQSASKSDHKTFDPNSKKRKLKHYLTKSKHRERLLSVLMRPNEIVILILSPLFFTFRLATRLVRRCNDLIESARDSSEPRDKG